MPRLVFVATLAMWVIVASFVDRCEQKSIAGMHMVRPGVILCLVMAMSDASRNERVAGGSAVTDPLEYPWMVSINPQYQGHNRRGKSFEDTFRCTGSFIDIYGSILTAGHCFRRRRRCKDKQNVTWNCKLRHTTVSWGNVSPLPYQGVGDTEVVPPGPRIRHFQVPSPKLRRPIDIALVYVKRFETSPMTYHPGAIARIRPIRLAEVQEMGSRPLVPNGTFAGFGSQPVLLNNGNWGYRIDGPLRKISMKSLGHFLVMCKRRIYTRKQTLLFAGQAVTDPSDDKEHQHPLYRGICLGDSGGPYMVKDLGRETLRGVAIRSVCGKDIPCTKFNTSSKFVDVNDKRVRAWIFKELKERYKTMNVTVSAIPMADMTA